MTVFETSQFKFENELHVRISLLINDFSLRVN